MIDMLVLPGAEDIQERAEEISDGLSGTLRLSVDDHGNDLDSDQWLGISWQAGHAFTYQEHYPGRVLVTVSPSLANQGLFRAAPQPLISAQARSRAPQSFASRLQGAGQLTSEILRRTAP